MTSFYDTTPPIVNFVDIQETIVDVGSSPVNVGITVTFTDDFGLNFL